MQVGIGLKHIREPLAHLALQESQHAANLLERKTLAPQLGDYGNLDDLFGLVEPLVTFMPRGNHFALVPPLELPQADFAQCGIHRWMQKSELRHRSQNEFSLF